MHEHATRHTAMCRAVACTAASICALACTCSGSHSTQRVRLLAYAVARTAHSVCALAPRAGLKQQGTHASYTDIKCERVVCPGEGTRATLISSMSGGYAPKQMLDVWVAVAGMRHVTIQSVGDSHTLHTCLKCEW
eukprot:17618-Chlamydomonas_euryale.AAC.1